MLNGARSLNVEYYEYGLTATRNYCVPFSDDPECVVLSLPRVLCSFYSWISHGLSGDEMIGPWVFRRLHEQSPSSASPSPFVPNIEPRNMLVITPM
jgi:hypothetical protein